MVNILQLILMSADATSKLTNMVYIAFQSNAFLLICFLVV